MADTNNLRDKVISTIYPNGKGAINAADHQALLLDMVTEMAKTNLDVFSLQKNKADKAAIPTKLSQLEQDIQVYDDTELREELTELSDETELLKEQLEENEILIEDLQNTKIDKEADDYYPQLAVGLADNLSGVDVVDSEVNFRRSGGGAISDGVARIEAIKGNSVVWNQLSGHGATSLSQESWEGNRVTINGTFEKETSIFDTESRGAELSFPNVGNKCLVIIRKISGKVLSGEVKTYAVSIVNGNNITFSADSTESYKVIFSTFKEGSTYHFYRRYLAGTVCENLVLEYQFIDLTKAFPNDWENINTIEDFYARIPMGIDLNAYNEGEVIHMDVQSIESVGVNQWDEEWEVGSLSSSNGNNATSTTSIRSKNYLSVVGGKEYYINALYNSFIFCYDKDKNFLGLAKDKGGATVMYNEAFSLLNDTAFIRFYSNSATYKNDICINLSDTSINGKYFPYIKRTEDLSIIRNYFPQGMKLAGSAHDEIRYNKVTQKWEMVEAIGTRTYQEGDADNASYLTDGKVTCYPLAEPIVTELDAEDQFKDLDYQVWNCGTEKAIAEGKSAPLAADITYGFNAIGKIKELESLVAALRAKVGI